MKNNIYEYESDLYEVLEKAGEFYEELSDLKSKIDKVNSKSVKDILEKLHDTVAIVYNNMIKIFKLYVKEIDLADKCIKNIGEILNDKSEYYRSKIKSLQDLSNNDFINQLLCEIQNDKNNLEYISEEFIKITDDVEYIHLAILKMVQITVLESCCVFKINDYGKYKAKKKQLKDAVKLTLELIPGLSEFIALTDCISVIERTANIEVYDDLKVDFYNTTDDNMCVLEQQIIMFNNIRYKQVEVIRLLNNICTFYENKQIYLIKKISQMV